MTFGRACDVWWDDEGCTNKETGLKFRLDWLTGQIGANKCLKDITPDDITKARNERAKCTRAAGKGPDGEQLYRVITPAAVRATMVTLRTVLNYAATAKGAAVRRFDWQTWIKKNDEEFDVRIMTATEEAKLWPVLAEIDEDVCDLAEFNLHHPKRINELIALSWSNTDLDEGFIRLKLKGRDKLKDDPIGPVQVDHLKRLAARRLHESAVFTYVSARTRAYNGVDHVKGQRRPMTYARFYDIWNEACARVGITDLNIHCLRHTGATRAYWDSKDIYFVSKLLNHADIKTTERYYLKTDPEVAREMMRTIADKRKAKVSATVSASKLKLVS